jgi:hypothetical protein
MGLRRRIEMRLDLQLGETFGTTLGIDQLDEALLELRGDFRTQRTVLVPAGSGIDEARIAKALRALPEANRRGPATGDSPRT